ncbi:MAG TPA: antibiotic biosynthesis monooxygenase family protein [Burkholderiaceae bacterium]|nr:antibiotic biosynthesis monooxygenase family protein [Burkholderiaceae bacterium]
MIYEVADFTIAPEQREAFEEAILRGVNTVISKSKGFIDFQVKRSIESPGRYLLVIRWETLENHTRDFRESAAFAEWRAIVGPFFAAPPSVEHFETVG